MGKRKKEIKNSFCKILDLQGVSCPQNAAQALLKLELLDFGFILEILLDDGEPILNVTNSLKLEGYKIFKKEKLNGTWKILVKKE